VKLRLNPKTRLGKWSILLIAAFIVMFISFQLLAASGQRGGDTFFSNLALSIPIVIAGISGISAFCTGIISIIKSKERSILVFLATLIGLFVLLFVSGEILMPH
jgi:hypothetical protein